MQCLTVLVIIYANGLFDISFADNTGVIVHFCCLLLFQNASTELLGTVVGNFYIDCYPIMIVKFVIDIKFRHPQKITEGSSWMDGKLSATFKLCSFIL